DVSRASPTISKAGARGRAFPFFWERGTNRERGNPPLRGGLPPRRSSDAAWTPGRGRSFFYRTCDGLPGRRELEPIEFGAEFLDQVGALGRPIVLLGHVVDEVVEGEALAPGVGEELPGAFPQGERPGAALGIVELPEEG